MDEKEFDNMNMVPMIDVMLVLLTIVLTTSTFIAGKSLPLSLPKADGNPAGKNQDTIIVEIDRYGIVRIGSLQVSIDELRTDLRQKERNRPVLVRADKDLELQRFVDVLDLVGNEGFRSVSLQTEIKR